MSFHSMVRGGAIKGRSTEEDTLTYEQVFGSNICGKPKGKIKSKV